MRRPTLTDDILAVALKTAQQPISRIASDCLNMAFKVTATARSGPSLITPERLQGREILRYLRWSVMELPDCKNESLFNK